MALALTPLPRRLGCTKAPRPLPQRTYPDGKGRIRLCTPPWTCLPWVTTEPIPAGWSEARLDAHDPARDPCLSPLGPTPEQLAAFGLGPRVPRPPRRPRDPRAARAGRSPRAARAPRTPRPAREPRPPRGPNERRPEARAKRPPVECVKNPAFNLCDCRDVATGTRVWSNWVAGAWAGAPPPPEAPFGCGDGMGTRNACQKQAAEIGGPIAQAFGWHGVAAPLPELQLAAAIEARKEALLPPPVAPIVTPFVPPLAAYVVPKEGTYFCVKDAATGRVDCYLNGTDTKVWSNYQHGAWQGEPAPAAAPFGAGLGA